MIDPLSLHRRLLTLDTHIDIPWPNGADPFTDTARRVDLPKMRRGHLTAGCFAAYVPQGPRSPEGRAAALSRALAMLEVIRGMATTRNGIEARLTTTVAETRQAHEAGAIAIIPAIENGHALGGDLANLARFRALGARYVTLCHNGHNDLCDSAHPRADLGDQAVLHHGLSAMGREAIIEMNRLGMLVDVSHLSRQAMLQAAMLSKTPVVATHSCVTSLCDAARNMDDQQLDALHEVGGVIQITAVSAFLRPRARPEDVTVSDFCDHIDYVVRRIGLAHVGISSDFDGGGGFTGWRDASESANLTAELVRRGYGEHEIAQLWGGNFLRIMEQAETSQGASPVGAGGSEAPPLR
jgi:membrane dipeptidase